MLDRPRSPAAPSDGATLSDAEEFSDLYLHRPVAAQIVRLLLRTPVTPNQVTALSGVAGVLAGVALARSVDQPALRLVSAGLLLASTILDCSDGQLARARKTMSANGMALDTAADLAVALSMVTAATAVVAQRGGSPLWWLLAPATLASYALQCFFFDVVKERFLAEHGLRYASSKAVQARDRPERPRGVQAWLFEQYWRVAGPLIDAPHAAPSRRIRRRAMRVWTCLGQGTHMTCLYVAAAVSYVWLPALVVCLLVFSVVMNVVMVALFITRRA